MKKPPLPPLKYGRHLSPHRIQQMALVLVGVLVIGGISFVGTLLNKGSHAAVAPGTLYVTPASGTFAPGSTISVDIREASGTEPVIDVQAGLVYNPAQLKYVSATEGVFPPANSMTDSTSKPNEILIFRGVSSKAAAVAGDNLVVTLNFQVLATSGTTSLSFNTGDSLIFGSNAGANIMTASPGASYTIQYPAPTVSTVSPSSGSTQGGTNVTITGTNFRSGATVTVGGSAATNVSVVSATQITATVPAHAAGAVDVVVKNSDNQSATKTGGFTYSLSPPTISGVSPVSGPAAGGTTVTVTGTNFVSGATVVVATTSATSVTVVSSTQLTFVTPSIGTGTTATVPANITVTNPDGQKVTSVDAFTYVAPSPAISSVTPSVVFADGGQTITITGTNFRSGATVTVGGTAASGVNFISGTLMTATAPAHAAGSVPVVVKNSDGTQSSAFTLSYHIVGDADGDGHVNGTDYGILVGHLGENYSQADFNHDGTVSTADLVILLGAWIW
jgi:hypothetical protein